MTDLEALRYLEKNNWWPDPTAMPKPLILAVIQATNALRFKIKVEELQKEHS